MDVIYEPKGRAREYSELACNLYSGCGFACSYCYAPQILRVKHADFKNAVPRKNILDRLTADAQKLQSDDRLILLSFTSDPYQPIDHKLQITRDAIKILHRFHHNVSVLTKAGHFAERDFDLMTSQDAHGATLTFLDETKSKQWEPSASPPHDRIQTLKNAYRLGIQTWASLEPVLDPSEVYKIIAQTHSFVDLFKVGVLNYHAHRRSINWGKFAIKVVKVLERYDCNYYLKDDLRSCLPPSLERRYCSKISEEVPT